MTFSANSVEIWQIAYVHEHPDLFADVTTKLRHRCGSKFSQSHTAVVCLSIRLWRLCEISFTATRSTGETRRTWVCVVVNSSSTVRVTVRGNRTGWATLSYAQRVNLVEKIWSRRVSGRSFCPYVYRGVLTGSSHGKDCITAYCVAPEWVSRSNINVWLVAAAILAT